MVGAAIECRHCIVAPCVTQVDAGTCCHGCSVCSSIVCIALLHLGCGVETVTLRSKCGVHVTIVGEWLGDAPTYICLLNIRYGLVLERVCLVEKETALPVGELLVLLAAVRQCGSALLDVLLSATYPCALGTCDDVGIEVVLFDDVFLSRSLAVVPWSRDCTGNVGITLLLVVDVALIDTYEVGEHIEVVSVVVTAVDVGQAVDDLAA